MKTWAYPASTPSDHWESDSNILNRSRACLSKLEDNTCVVQSVGWTLPARYDNLRSRFSMSLTCPNLEEM
eukprot:5931182-Amphidinium_carterae.1